MPKSSARNREKTHLALRILFDANWTATDIARAFGYSVHTITVWRREAGIECSRPKIDDRQARNLHAMGLSDHQIGKEIGIGQCSVTRWRNSRGLSANFPRGRSPAFVANRRKAMQLIRLGASKDKIASILGIHRRTIQNYRRDVKDGAPRGSGISDTNLRKAALKDKSLARRIETAIGSHVPAHIRADATSDLFVDVLDGLVSSKMIEVAAPSYRSRAYDMCGSKFGARRLDEEIGEDWTLGDTLADPDAWEAMEEAAARAYENDNW